MLGPKLVEAPENVRSNLFVIEELAKRLGVADLPGFGLSERQHIDAILDVDGLPDYDTLLADKWFDRQPDFASSHYLDGFAHPDRKFRFRPDWTGQQGSVRPPDNIGLMGPVAELPEFPDFCPVIELADAEHPFRLATPPARNFLNSTFAETKTSRDKEGRPEVMIAPLDAAALDIVAGDIVTLGNPRGSIRIHARVTDAVKPGVLVAEGLWPNKAHLDGEGINVLTGADNVAPFGGVGLHDNRVWLRKEFDRLA